MLKRTLLIAGLFTAATASILSAAAAVHPPAPAPAPANPVAGKPPELTPQQTQFFETKIRPILADKCYKCHAVDAVKIKGGLLLDSREGIAKGGESGPVVVLGNPGKSRLILAITYKD